MFFFERKGGGSLISMWARAIVDPNIAAVMTEKRMMAMPGFIVMVMLISECRSRIYLCVCVCVWVLKSEDGRTVDVMWAFWRKSLAPDLRPPDIGT